MYKKSPDVFGVEFDELRIGDTSLDETVPLVFIPEPSAAILMALGAIAVLQRR